MLFAVSPLSAARWQTTLPAGGEGAEAQPVPAAHGGAGGCWVAVGCWRAYLLFYNCRLRMLLDGALGAWRRAAHRQPPAPNPPTPPPQGSRKHYCINMHATKQASIDEACEELLKESQVGGLAPWVGWHHGVHTAFHMGCAEWDCLARWVVCCRSGAEPATGMHVPAQLIAS